MKSFQKRISDGGLQPERTSLSWSRTLFVLLLDTLLVIKVGHSHNNDFIIYSGLILSILTLLFYLTTVYRSPKLSLDIELNSKNDLWMKKLMCYLLVLSSGLVSISCMINIFYFL